MMSFMRISWRYAGTSNSWRLFEENVARSLYMKSLLRLWNLELIFLDWLRLLDFFREGRLSLWLLA